MHNRTIYFILTNKCNYSCNFCIRKNIHNEGDMSAEQGVQALSRLADIYPSSVLIFTGGEPFLHHNWEVFLKSSLSLFKRIVITSNGSFSNETAQRLKSYLSRNLYLQISLDGIESVHDNLRGVDAYSKVISNVLLFEDYSSHISISSTISKESITSSRGLVGVVNNLKIAFWKVSQEQLEIPTIDNIISNDEWNGFVDYIVKESEHPVIVSKYYDFGMIRKLLNSVDYKNQPIIKNCGFGRNKMYITPSFDVKLCSCIDVTVGNLFKDDWVEIENRLQNIGEPKLDQNSACYNCEFKNWCNGGCPGYSYKFFKKFGMGDIRCPLVQKSLQ